MNKSPEWKAVDVFLKYYISVNKNSRIYIPAKVLSRMPGSDSFQSLAVYSQEIDGRPIRVKFEFHAEPQLNDIDLPESTKIMLQTGKKSRLSISSKKICELYFPGILQGTSDTPVKIPVEVEDTSVIFEPILSTDTPIDSL